MLKSVLLAGFLWAAANLMPVPAVGTPTAVANTFTHSARMPVLMASAPRPLRSPQARMVWDAPAPILSAPASPDALSPEEQEFIVKVNAERTSRGLNALTVDPLLVHTARAHSREMCARDYFDHHSPTPGLESPMDRYLKGPA